MHPETWLDDLAASPWRVRILRALAREPARMWTERELAKHLHASPNTVNLHMRVLRDAGVLEFRRLGRSNVVRLSQGGLATRLRDLFATEASTMDDLRKAVRAATPKGVACLLYGSTARGQARHDSDVDLLVVAPTLAQAESAAVDVRAAMQAVFPVKASIAAVPVSRLKRPPPWLRNALREGKVWSETRAEEVG